MNINNKFKLQQCVFLITDTEQRIRIITGIQISNNGLLYRLACGIDDSWHFEYEIVEEKNYLI
jgi:hypothetical protein